MFQENMNIFKNYLYNVTYQLLIIILPIITTPYISRVLEVDGVGEYSFSAAIVNYFVLFGVLGINTYGNRQVAYVRDDKEQLSHVFWEIVLLKICTMTISIIGFYLFVLKLVPNENAGVYYIQLFTLVGSLIDISWFFHGLEQFKKTATRNIIVKLISVILVFLLVKDKDDIWLYALIVSGSLFIGQVIIWPEIKGRVYFVKPKIYNVVFHLKNTFFLWIPSLAIQIYSSLDKVMLGFITDNIQVGLYENSQKIVKMAAAVTTALSMVTLPKVSNSFKNKNIPEIQKVTNLSFSMISLISFPMAFGIIAVRETLVPWFYGPGYEEIINLLSISGWIIITLGWSSVFGTQILIGCSKEKEFTIAVIVGAAVNIILNSIFISKFQVAGAVVASVVAEYTGMLLMLFFVRKIINIKGLFKPIPNYLLASLVMYVIVYYIGKLISLNLLATIVQVITGLFIYCGILIVLRDKNIKYIGIKVVSLIKRP